MSQNYIVYFINKTLSHIHLEERNKISDECNKTGDERTQKIDEQFLLSNTFIINNRSFTLYAYHKKS